MNSRRFKRQLPLLLLGAAFMASGWLGAVSGRATDTSVDYGAEETDKDNATTPEAPPARQVRRLRSSLSMPYFSFAQAVSPRS